MVKKTIVALPFDPLCAITPLDGRYKSRTDILAKYVSEYALIKTRIEVEAKYLIALSEFKIIRKLAKKEKEKLLKFADNLLFEQIQNVKKLEQQTRHDVKAAERIFRELLSGTSLEDLTEMIHFGLTSEDINNISYRLLFYRATQEVIIPELQSTLDTLVALASKNKSVPMLARTHGQAAVPTTLGKEIAVFVSRLNKQLAILKRQKLTGKLNGAVGNFNALSATFPKVNWIEFSKKFIVSLDLWPNLITTQINTYDDIAEYAQIYQRINSILLDLDQDIWRYISDGWFTQVVKKGEVGSSTMPQKVNPIDFENSEGNLGIANALLEFMARKLMVSRLQRDLSDSTVVRNIGTVLGYCLVGYLSLSTGLSRISPNFKKIEEALVEDWTILTEGVQTILRRAGVKDPYTLVASLVRGAKIQKPEWEIWIKNLPIEDSYKNEIKKLTPKNYIGLAETLVDEALKDL